MLFRHIFRSISLFILTFVVAFLPFSISSADETSELYFVDAHSQLPKGLDQDKIIPLMDQAGVWHTILSARNDRDPEDVADLSAKHQNRITAAIRSKGKAFNKNTPKFKKLINRQLARPEFNALGEVLLFHAKKGNKAPEISVDINSPQVAMLLSIAKENQWPFIAHYEFRASWDKSSLMEAFENTAKKSPDHPHMLIHMGQLDSADIKRLIENHKNVYFIMSHCNPVSIAKNPGQPWTNLFKGDRLKPEWAEIIVKNPERFVLAFDNVWPDHWGNFYIKQATLWRKALVALPSNVAHAVAHGNAEKLWKLPHK